MGVCSVPTNRVVDVDGRWQVDRVAPMVTWVCTHDEGTPFHLGQL